VPKPPISTVAPSFTSASASATEAAILLIIQESPDTAALRQGGFINCSL
jgi:hypothetical protein